MKLSAGAWKRSNIDFGSTRLSPTYEQSPLRRAKSQGSFIEQASEGIAASSISDLHGPEVVDQDSVRNIDARPSGDHPQEYNCPSPVVKRSSISLPSATRQNRSTVPASRCAVPLHDRCPSGCPNGSRCFPRAGNLRQRSRAPGCDPGSIFGPAVGERALTAHVRRDSPALIGATPALSTARACRFGLPRRVLGIDGPGVGEPTR